MASVNPQVDVIGASRRPLPHPHDLELARHAIAAANP